MRAGGTPDFNLLSSVKILGLEEWGLTITLLKLRIKYLNSKDQLNISLVRS